MSNDLTTQTTGIVDRIFGFPKSSSPDLRAATDASWLRSCTRRPRRLYEQRSAGCAFVALLIPEANQNDGMEKAIPPRSLASRRSNLRTSG